MKPERWRVHSLRRFRDHEVLLYIYLGIGGLFSMIYFVAAAVQTRLYMYLFSVPAWTEGVILKVLLNIIVLSIMRAILWLPQLFWQVILGGASFIDWLIAVNILKEMA